MTDIIEASVYANKLFQEIFCVKNANKGGNICLLYRTREKRSCMKERPRSVIQDWPHQGGREVERRTFHVPLPPCPVGQQKRQWTQLKQWWSSAWTPEGDFMSTVKRLRCLCLKRTVMSHYTMYSVKETIMIVENWFHAVWPKLLILLVSFQID